MWDGEKKKGEHDKCEWDTLQKNLKLKFFAPFACNPRFGILPIVDHNHDDDDDHMLQTYNSVQYSPSSIFSDFTLFRTYVASKANCSDSTSGQWYIPIFLIKRNFYFFWESIIKRIWVWNFESLPLIISTELTINTSTQPNWVVH